MRIADVEAKAAIGRSTVYRRITAGTFPVTFDIGDDGGEGGVRWRASNIELWMASHPRRTYRSQSA